MAKRSGKVEHEAAPPGSCAGYRPLCRGSDARATDHARADPAPDGRADRRHLSAGAQVREGDQSRRRGAPYHIAQANGVEVGYFFDGLGRDNAFKATPQQRLLLEFGRNFIAIPIRKTRMPSAHLRAPWPSPTPGTEPRLLVAPVQPRLPRWSREPRRPGGAGPSGRRQARAIALTTSLRAGPLAGRAHCRLMIGFIARQGA